MLLRGATFNSISASNEENVNYESPWPSSAPRNLTSSFHFAAFKCLLHCSLVHIIIPSIPSPSSPLLSLWQNTSISTFGSALNLDCKTVLPFSQNQNFIQRQQTSLFSFNATFAVFLFQIPNWVDGPWHSFCAIIHRTRPKRCSNNFYFFSKLIRISNRICHILSP